MVSISTLVDRVKIYVRSSGTGPFELGAAVPAYRGIEALVDGSTYSYAVESGSNYEAGTGVYLQSANSLVRAPTISSAGNAAVSFPVGVELVFTALAQDIVATGGTLPIADSLGDDRAVAISQRATTAALSGKYDAESLTAEVIANALTYVPTSPAYIQSRFSSREANFLDIADYDPDGETDMASGLTTLLAQAATDKVPTVSQGGKFLLGSPVSIPRGTDLRGAGSPSFGTEDNAGTVLYLAHGGKGLVDVGGTGGCLMSDIVFYRDQPPVVEGEPWEPNDDDFDIYSADMSDFHATRVYHMNSTRGVFMNGNRNRFTDCCGQFFKRGLQVDWSYDTLRVVGSHKWPFFSQATEVREYMQNNMQLYTLGRVDNPMFLNPFSIWAKYCFYIGYFPGDGPNKPAGTTSKLKLIGADLDIGQHAYFVAPEANGHSAKFSAVTSQGMAEIVEAAPLQIEGPNTKIIGDFSGSDVGANLVRVEASAAGTECSLLVTGNNWNRSNDGFPAVEVVTGGGHITLLPGSVPLLTNGNGGAISSGNVTVVDDLL